MADNKVVPKPRYCTNCTWYVKTDKNCNHPTNIRVNQVDGTTVYIITAQMKRTNPNDCGPEGKYFNQTI